MRLALAIVAWVSKLNRASTSVETTPGISFRISMPKFTANLSRTNYRINYLMNVVVEWAVVGVTIIIKEKI